MAEVDTPIYQESSHRKEYLSKGAKMMSLVVLLNIVSGLEIHCARSWRMVLYINAAPSSAHYKHCTGNLLHALFPDFDNADATPLAVLHTKEGQGGQNENSA